MWIYYAQFINFDRYYLNNVYEGGYNKNNSENYIYRATNSHGILRPIHLMRIFLYNLIKTVIIIMNKS